MGELQKSHFLIYRSEDGKIKLDVRFEGETVWLTQAMIVELFQSSKSSVSEHIKHIFEEGELERELVVRKFRTTTTDEYYKYKYAPSAMRNSIFWIPLNAWAI